MGKIKVFQSNVVKIDKRVYGDDGYLPGVEKDRENWGRFFKQIGAEIVKSCTDTTTAQFVDGMEKLYSSCKAGDLAIIQHSGHGTQVRDKSGDEKDGKDEVLCLYDNTFLDDKLWNMLVLFDKGVNVLLITDTCHSGTMYRSVIGQGLQSSAEAVNDSSRDINCNLLAIGTCTDAQTSADTRSGGAGSSALLNAYQSSSDYRDWVLKAQNWLIQNRFNQTIVLNEVEAGNFVSSKPFSIPNTTTINIGNSGNSGSTEISQIKVIFKDGTSSTFT